MRWVVLLRRLYVRGKENVHKKLLLQAAACNLALLLRKVIGARTPRALQDVGARLIVALLRLISATKAVSASPPSLSVAISRRMSHRGRCAQQEAADS
jgi:hypothetical protein